MIGVRFLRFRVIVALLPTVFLKKNVFVTHLVGISPHRTVHDPLLTNNLLNRQQPVLVSQDFREMVFVHSGVL